MKSNLSLGEITLSSEEALELYQLIKSEITHQIVSTWCVYPAFFDSAQKPKLKLMFQLSEVIDVDLLGDVKEFGVRLEYEVNQRQKKIRREIYKNRHSWIYLFFQRITTGRDVAPIEELQ